ncbi:MAG: bifunctional UDP-sugar hydrolase/5'-nucleotidase [Elusimicrobiales bacterium]|nr:bifunctional UDP-sugar hydrolase/5'-nucleotidase [Elusimicrobiales bacterium]
MKKIFFLLTLLLAAGGRAAALTVAVYHTSDAHGWYSARPARWDNAQPARLIGGFAALAAQLEKETSPYLLLDSGDMFQGTPEGILTKGLASVTLMNQLGYAAAAPGNHDYDYGEGPLKAMIAAAKFPFLAANVYEKKTGAPAPYFKPYTVLTVAGKRIAVLGLAGSHTGTSTRPDGVRHLEFRDEAAEAAARLPEIKKLAPDAVILLIHRGITEDLSVKSVDVSTWTFEDLGAHSALLVARAAPGIDLLLGGHHHAALLNGYRDPVSGTVLGESGYGLSNVTRAELTFDEATGKLTGVSAGIVPLWVDQTGQDPAVLATIAGFSAQVEKEMGQTVGQAKTDLLFSPERLDSGIGNWVSDVTREVTGAQLAFQNTGAIRAEIRKGPVRLRDLYQAMPFDNNIITMRLTGAQVRRLLADNLVGPKSFMQVSGLTVEFKPGPGREPALLRVKYRGREIKDAQEFTIATNDYLAGGGDGGAVFSGGKEIEDTMLPVRDALIKAFAKGPVSAPPAGRIKRLP